MYSSWTKAKLEQEIKRRNSQRNLRPRQTGYIRSTGNKAVLIERLQTDDGRTPTPIPISLPPDSVLKMEIQDTINLWSSTWFDIDISMKDNYVSKFGNRFYNIWKERSRTAGKHLWPILLIRFSLIKPQEKLFKNSMWELSEFTLHHKSLFLKGTEIITPDDIKYIPKTQRRLLVPVESIMTREEREFFKGLGYSILCKVLSLLEDKKPGFKDDNILTLSAGGNYLTVRKGSVIQNLESLVNYYRRIGFNPVYKEYIRQAMSNPDKIPLVPMYGEIRRIKQICSQKAKNVMVDM